MNENIRLKTIAYICLYTSNVEEAVKFYRDVLGLIPTDSNLDPTSATFYSFQTGETMLAIEPKGIRKNGMKTKAENPVLLQFKMESAEELEQMNKRLEEKGVTLLERSKQTAYGMITDFCDPDGNKVEILCQ